MPLLSERAPIPGDVVRQVGGLSVHCIDGIDYLSPSTVLQTTPWRFDIVQIAADMGKSVDQAQHIINQAAARGTFVGAACALEAEGTLDWTSVPEKWRGYVEAFKRWRDETGFALEAAEELVLDAKRGVFGYRDLRGVTRHGEALTVELKTTATPSAAHCYQLAAYVDATHEGVVLYLPKKGTAVARLLQDDDMDTFDVMARHAHTWVREYEGKGRKAA